MLTMNASETIEWLQILTNAQSLLPPFITLTGVLAKGGQGVVYLGKVESRDAAIKIYFPGQLQQRVDREVLALGKMNCPSIVKLLWNGSISVFEYSLPVVATELINGIDLEKFYRENDVTLDHLGTFVYDIACAIDAMWSNRIVHRDLKPSNILIQRDGRACVIDLGVARHIEQSTLTAIGSTWGTLGYMSPEQAKTLRQLTCKSDVYALGILIVECSIKRHPSGHDQLKLFSLELFKKLPEPLESWKYSGFVRSMLHPDPIQRPKPQDLLVGFSEFRKEEK